jgi:hypothetical protein
MRQNVSLLAEQDRDQASRQVNDLTGLLPDDAAHIETWISARNQPATCRS